MLKEFPQMRPLFRRRIQYISPTFLHAFVKGQDKLIEVLPTTAFKQSGTIIWPLEKGNITIFYDINAEEIDDQLKLTNGTMIYFIKNKELPEPGLLLLANYRQNIEMCM